MKMIEALTTKWNESKGGYLGPDYYVLLHLWKYGTFPDDDHLISAQAWTVYQKKASDFDTPVSDPATYLRKTNWNFAYDILPKDPTDANIEEAIIVRETTVDIEEFQAQLALGAQIDIPVVLSRQMIVLASGYECGLSIPGSSAPGGISITWKEDGPDAWQSLIAWAEEMIKTLDEKMSDHDN